MYKIQTLNSISRIIFSQLKEEKYAISAEETAPDAILVRSAARSLSGDGEPEVATTIDYEAVTSRYVQTRERGTVGIVAGGVDGITSTVDLGGEGHLTEVAAADHDRSERSRCRHAAARDALADAIDGGRSVVDGFTGCDAAAAARRGDIVSGTCSTCACVVKVVL